MMGIAALNPSYGPTDPRDLPWSRLNAATPKSRCSASGTRDSRVFDDFDERARNHATYPRHEKAPVGGGRFL